MADERTVNRQCHQCSQGVHGKPRPRTQIRALQAFQICCHFSPRLPLRAAPSGLCWAGAFLSVGGGRCRLALQGGFLLLPQPQSSRRQQCRQVQASCSLPSPLRAINTLDANGKCSRHLS